MLSGMATNTRAVGTTSAVAPRDLNTYYKNPRRGDIPAIAASLKAHDQYKPIVVNLGTHTGRPNEVLAGNHTLMAVRSLAESHPEDSRWENILVHWLDVDEDRAARIVVADNRTSELGHIDTAVLSEILDAIGTDLDGLGYTNADIAELQAALDVPEPQDGGVPLGEPVISYLLVFDDEKQQVQWVEFLKTLKRTYPDMDTVAERLSAWLVGEVLRLG
jgi:hypothetical protein